MAVKAMTQLPRAMLIDMDDTILSAYGRPEIAWNTVAEEFAGEFAPLLPQQVSAAVLNSARQFWAAAGAEWRLKLEQARHEVVLLGVAVVLHGAQRVVALRAPAVGAAPRSRLGIAALSQRA